MTRPIEYTHKSETWVRTALQMRILLDQAENERARPYEFPRPFSMWGNRSVFSARVATFKTVDPFVNAIAECNPGLFKKLYRTVE